MARTIPVDTAQVRRPLPALSQHRIARFAAIMVLYFLQGVPWGLSAVAIPAWLAANGAGPTEVSVFVATAILPWSLKPLNGILMDRFAYKPMGRRRAWILAAQALMLASLIALALLDPPASEISLLAALCFTLNVSATLNDVAIDGMAVDIVPHEERTAVNSCMFASQAMGIAATSAIAGQLLASSGLVALGLVLAGLVAAASIFVSLFRERPGERLLPWSPGRASAECEARQQGAWLPIMREILAALMQRTTAIFLLGAALSMATFALIEGVAPTLAVQALGWSGEGYSNFAAMVNIVAALVGLAIPVLLVRLTGLRAAIIGVCLALGALAAIGGAMFGQGDASRVFQALTMLQYSLATVLQVITIVWAMRICSPTVAASLFAVFMAVPNFGRTILIGWSGPVVEAYGYGGAYVAVAILSLATAALFVLARAGDDRIVPSEALR
jgi:PAT family beta-lactamase induction signal transducer AmpG